MSLRQRLFDANTPEYTVTCRLGTDLPAIYILNNAPDGSEDIQDSILTREIGADDDPDKKEAAER